MANNKRPFHEANGGGYQGAGHNHQIHKKHKTNHGRSDGKLGTNHSKLNEPKQTPLGFDEALSHLPPPTSALGSIPPYTPFTVPAGLPPLPAIPDPTLSTAPFKHKSLHPHDRSTTTNDTTYERLEFLGDAQLEHIASRLIYTRYNFLPAGQQSSLREQLVKNETLCEYARWYGFDERVKVADMEQMKGDSRERGNKGFNKVLGDVFEAYLAAVVVGNGEEGFAIAEKWMQSLWAPKLVELAKVRGFERERRVAEGLVGKEGKDLVEVYDPAAKGELQRRILGSKEDGVKLEYEAYREMVELKGELLGQNRHFIAVLLTGYGYEREVLGRGEGKNKVEAGNWAAVKAMYGEKKGVVEECERILNQRKKERMEARAKLNGETNGDEHVEESRSQKKKRKRGESEEV